MEFISNLHIKKLNFIVLSLASKIKRTLFSFYLDTHQKNTKKRVNEIYDKKKSRLKSVLKSTFSSETSDHIGMFGVSRSLITKRTRYLLLPLDLLFRSG